MASTIAAKADAGFSGASLCDGLPGQGEPFKATTSQRIYQLIVSPTRQGMWRAYVGCQHVCTARQPLFETARILLAEGVDPAAVLVMRHRDSNVEAMRGRIGALAGLTVRETDADGPRLASWKAFPARAVAPPVGATGEGATQAAYSMGDAR